MKDLKVKGKIIKISDIQTFDSGSAKLSFRIDTGEEWNNIVEFEMFKKQEYKEHLDNFIKYNNIGDEVEVTFNISTNHYTGNGKDAVFTKLSFWKLEKIGEQTKEQPKEDANDELPF